MFFLSAGADSCLSPDQGHQLRVTLGFGGEGGGYPALQSSFPGTAPLVPREAVGDSQGRPYLSQACRRYFLREDEWLTQDHTTSELLRLGKRVFEF